MHMMQDPLEEKLSLDDLAHRMNMSKDHFDERFL